MRPVESWQPLLPPQQQAKWYCPARIPLPEQRDDPSALLMPYTTEGIQYQRMQDHHEAKTTQGYPTTVERKMASLETLAMELEDSHSAVQQSFLVGDSVYTKLGDVARVLTEEQKQKVFGVSSTTIQFYDLVQTRFSICPLCRFEFDAVKPLSYYADAVRDRTQKVTQEIAVLVGRKNAKANSNAEGDDSAEGGLYSRQNLGSASSVNSLRRGASFNSFRSSQAVATGLWPLGLLKVSARDTKVSPNRFGATSAAVCSLEARCHHGASKTNHRSARGGASCRRTSGRSGCHVKTLKHTVRRYLKYKDFT